MPSAASLQNRADLAGKTLRVAGLTPLTTIDFPGRLAAVIFLQGCPWRCGYCHNPQLLDATQPGAMDWAEVLSFVARRMGLIDGVVFSGGEPLLQRDLLAALQSVRELGFATAVHTGGAYPDALQRCLPWLDWVGLDIKAPIRLYDAITRVPGSGVRAWASLLRVLEAGVDLECRTTWREELFSADALKLMADELAKAGVRRWVLQRCRIPGRLDRHPDAVLLADLATRVELFEYR